MTRFIIQILAMLFMTVDHIGMLLVPYGTLYEILRNIGRLAFPLFAFLLGEGFRHTKNIFKYFLRLFIFGSIIEIGAFIGQFIFGNTGHTELNIYLTLAMGLLISYLLKHKNPLIKLLSILPLFLVFLTDSIIPSVRIFGKYLGISFEYGLFGIFTILSFTLFKKPIIQSIALFLTTFMFVNHGLIDILNIKYLLTVSASEWYMLLTIPVFFLYNGKNGPIIPKLVTYTYYPGHLLILFLLS